MTLTRTASDEIETQRDRYDDQLVEPEPYEAPRMTPDEVWRRFSVPIARRCATHRHL